MESSKQENAPQASLYLFIASLVVGLACMDIWPDLLGHCSALAPANDAFARAGMNARFAWSAGLACTCFAVAVFPSQVKKFDSTLSAIAPIVGVMASSFYAAFAVGLLDLGAASVGACILAAAVCYSWFEVRLVSLTGRALAFSTIVAALAASRVMKLALVAIFGLAPDAVQIAGACAMPIATGISAIAASRIADGASSRALAVRGMADVPFSRSSVLSDTVVATVFLVACSVLSAVARSVSDLGYWGNEYVIGAEYIFLVLPVGIVLAAVVYLVFFRLKEGEMLSYLVVLFLVVLGGLYLETPELVGLVGLPAVVSSLASVVTELFSQFLFWVSIIAAMRLGGVVPYRAVGLGEGSMSAAALVLGVGLYGVQGAGGVLAGTSTYAILIVTWYLLRRMQWMQNSMTGEQGAADPLEAACDAASKRGGLTPREDEVLRLLARGRSRTFIQSELFLSDGTVKTHIRHIYQKLDVHSKQELISLISGSEK